MKTLKINSDVTCQLDKYLKTDVRNECSISDFTEGQFRTNICSPLQAVMDQQLLKQTHCDRNSELETDDLINWLEKEQSEGLEEQMIEMVATSNSAKELVLTRPGELETIEKLTAYIPASSRDILTNLQEKRANLILLATSIDQGEAIKKLENALDPKTSRMIPLYQNDHCEMPELDVVSCSSGKSDCSTDENSCDEKSELKAGSLKRKRLNDKDDKYWKRRSSNNEAAKRSREAKRDRFAWIENRTTELMNENAELEKHLESLKLKMISLQNWEMQQS